MRSVGVKQSSNRLEDQNKELKDAKIPRTDEKNKVLIFQWYISGDTLNITIVILSIFNTKTLINAAV